MANITKRTGKRGDSYLIRVFVDQRGDGTQTVKSMTWRPAAGMTPKQIEKELNRQAVLFEEQAKSGQILKGETKLSDFVDVWLKDYAEKQLKPSTISFYRSSLKRILPALGHIRLDRLQPHHLLSFYDNLAESGIRDDTKYKSVSDLGNHLKIEGIKKTHLAKKAGINVWTVDSAIKGNNITEESARKIATALGKSTKDLFAPCSQRDTLSSNTIRHHHRALSSILQTAVEWQVIYSNPCSRIKPPKVEKSAPRYLDDEQARALLETLQNAPPQYRAMIQVLLYTGMRRGELCGLEWDDIDFENSVIHIRRESLYLVELGTYVENGKSASAVRSIKAPSLVMEVLRLHKAWQATERLKVGDKWEDHNRLFATWNGKPIYPGTITTWFREFVKLNGLPNINVHSLRHSNATLMIATGTPITTVSKRLGHATPSTTSTIYAHAIRSADEAAAEAIGDMLAKKDA